MAANIVNLAFIVQVELGIGNSAENGLTAAFGYFNEENVMITRPKYKYGVGDQIPVDRFGDEIGRAGFKGAVDRLHVVHTGYHHDR